MNFPIIVIYLIDNVKANPKKYTTLLGGVIMMFCLGSISTLATMSPYYMSFLREYNDLKHVRYSQTIWLQTFYLVNFLFFSVCIYLVMTI